MKIECSIKLISSANSKDFKRALDIYHNEVPTNIRTNENEILQYLSKKCYTKKRDMLFYVMYCNEIIIGYCEVGVLKTSKAFFIDYFILDNEYKNNAYFYMCYNLLIVDLRKRYNGYKYIIAEYYSQKKAKSIDSSFGKKCLSLEDYKIIDKKYMQPGLNKNDPDSIVECQLLIKETSNNNTLFELSASKYISILKDIYINHYIEWYSHFFTSQELAQYSSLVEELINKTQKKCGNKPVNLINYTYINCKYYNPSKCELSINSQFKIPNKRSKAVYYFSLLILLLFANIVAFLSYLLFSKVLKFQDSVISIIFPVVIEIIFFFGSRVTAKFINPL